MRHTGRPGTTGLALVESGEPPAASRRPVPRPGWSSRMTPSSPTTRVIVDRRPLVVIEPLATLLVGVGDRGTASGRATDYLEEHVVALDYTDRTDFEDADRGFVASIDPVTIKNAEGRTVFDLVR